MLTPKNKTYKASDNYFRDLDKRAMKQGAYTALAKITVVGTNIEFTEEYGLVDWNYEDYRYVPNNGIIGQFVERILDIQLTKLDTETLENKEINLQIGIVNGLDNQTTYYDYGNFLITNIVNDDTTDLIKLELSDYTKKFNRNYSNNIYYPCTALELSNNICTQADVTFHSYADAYISIVSEEFLDMGNYFIRVTENGSEKYVKIVLNDKLNKLDSIMLVYDTINTPFAVIKQIFPNGHIIRTEIEIDSTDITDNISEVSGYTELICNQCGYQPFANNDFIIENNQFEDDATLREAIKWIGQLGYSWVRIGRDNECYIDFTVKDDDDIDEENELTTDEYYTSNKADLYYGPVNSVELGLSGVEGETFYNRREDKSITELVLKGKSFQFLEPGISITPEVKYPIHNEPGIENIFDKDRLKFIKQYEHQSSITFINDGIELYIPEDSEHPNGFILPDSDSLLSASVYIHFDDNYRTIGLRLWEANSETGEIDLSVGSIYIENDQVITFPVGYRDDNDCFAITFGAFEIERTIPIKNIIIAKSSLPVNYVPSGHKYLNVYNNSRNLFNAEKLTFYALYWSTDKLPVVDSNTLTIDTHPEYPMEEACLENNRQMPAGTYYMELKAFSDDEGSQISDVAGMRVWDSSYDTCYGSMMFDTDELTGDITKRISFTIPEPEGDEDEWYSFEFVLNNTGGTNSVTFSDILLSKEDISYEPYRYKSTLYNLDGILLDGIDNYQDEYDVINGHITKRIGTYVIDNTAEKVDTYTNVAFVKIPKTEDNITYNSNNKQKILCDCALYNSADISDDVSLIYDIMEDNLYYYICCDPYDLDETYELCQGGIIKYVLSDEGVYDIYTEDTGSPELIDGYNRFQIDTYNDSCDVVVTDLYNNQKTYNYHDGELYDGLNRAYIVFNPIDITTIQLFNNPLTYTDELRRIALQDADVLFGFKYMPSEINSIGHIWFQGDDLLELTNTNNETFVTYPFNRSIYYKGYIKSDLSSMADTQLEEHYEYANNVDKKIGRVRLVVDKANHTITQLIEESNDTNKLLNETISTVDGTVATISNLQKTSDTLSGQIAVLERKIDGISVDTSLVGGNNLIRNSVGYFGTDYWQINDSQEGDVKSINDVDVKTHSISGSGLLLQNESIYQSINGIKKGNYRLSFSYKLLKPLSTCFISINDSVFNLDDDSGWVEVSEPILVQLNNILLTISSNMDDSCIITDLILTSGYNEVTWEQNANETFTDTVKIGKGIKISSTGSDTSLEATASGIEIKNTSTNETTSRFDKYGTTTDSLTAKNSLELADSLMIKKVGDQIWFISIN